MADTILEMALASDELLEKKERTEKEETEVKAKRVASYLDSLATSLTILSENLSELSKIVQVLRNVKVNDILNEKENENPIEAFMRKQPCDNCLFQNTPSCKIFGIGVNGEMGCSFKERVRMSELEEN